jgi:hypothetical protein
MIGVSLLSLARRVGPRQWHVIPWVLMQSHMGLPDPFWPLQREHLATPNITIGVSGPPFETSYGGHVALL